MASGRLGVVDPGYAAWLKGEELKVTLSTDSAARWPSQGVAASSSSPFALLDGAEREGERRAAFLGGPLVKEQATVLGELRALINRCVTLCFDGLGYAPEGETVFVIAVDEQTNGTSILTILRKLS